MALIVGETSYVDVATATTYLADHIDGASWADATQQQQEAALVSATRAIDRLLLRGAPAEDGQSLAFPRKEMTGYGWHVQRAVPQAVLDAVCEQALFLLSLTDYDRDRLRQHALGVIGGGIGAANEYSDTTLVRRNQAREPICPAARQLLARFVARTLRL